MDHIEEAVACALSPNADPALKQQVRVHSYGLFFFFSLWTIVLALFFYTASKIIHVPKKECSWEAQKHSRAPRVNVVVNWLMYHRAINAGARIRLRTSWTGPRPGLVL